MFSDFIKLIAQNWPFGAFLLACIYATWKAANYHDHWTSRIKTAEKDCTKIDSQIMPEISNLSNSVLTVNKTLNGLVIYLKTKDGKMDTSLFQSYSPIKLTPLGEEVINALNGKQLIDSNLTFLFQQFEHKNIKTALDVQTLAPIIIGSFSEQNEFNEIKNYIYKNPVYRTKSQEGSPIEVTLENLPKVL